MTDNTDTIIKTLDKRARQAGMSDEARNAWVTNNAPLYGVNAKGKVRRIDRPEISPRKSLEALRRTTPDAFNGVAPKSNAPVDNPWTLPAGPEGDVARARYVKTFGTQKAIAFARAANVDLAGRPLRGTP